MKEPENLEECLSMLMEVIPLNIQEKLKNGSISTTSLHHSLGRFLRNEWDLWGPGESSKLLKWFKDIGIHHPDDMSGIILDSLVLKLNGEPINLETQIKFYQDYWKNIQENKNIQVQVSEDGKISIL